MSVVRVWEIVGQREADFADDQTRRYRRLFGVECDDPQDDARLVRLATGVPRIGTPYSLGDSQDSGSLCTKLRPKQTSKYVWEVNCSYESKKSTDPQQQKPPLERPPVIVWNMEHRQVFPTHDAAGDPLRNTAGDVFDPPPAMDRTILICTITRNEASYNAQLALQYANKVNKAPWYVFPKHVGKIANIGGRSMFEDGANFWEVTYEIQLDDELWIPTLILSVGPRYRDAADKLIVAKDDHDVAHGGHVLLDVAGGKLPKGGAPHWIHFTMYKEADFNLLNLP